MAASIDYTGTSVLGWTVSHKAPAQNRVRFWTCECENCGRHADIAHTAVRDAVAGKVEHLLHCIGCAPAENVPAIDKGMHLACGREHLVGTPCGKAGPGECKHAVMVQDCGDCGPLMGDAPPMAPPVPPLVNIGEPIANFTRPGMVTRPAGSKAWDLEAITDEPVAPKSWDLGGECALTYGDGPDDGCDCTGCGPSPALPSDNDMAHADVDSVTGSTTIFGRVDRLEAPQIHLDVIRAGMHARERNHQSQPGPSQIGGCMRRLGGHLATGVGNGRRDDDAWRPEVGTAVHAWIAPMFQRAGGYVVSHRVLDPVEGEIDVFHLATYCAIDFKVSGPTVRKEAEKGRIKDKYEVQLDLYGLGLANQGFDVRRVALLFLPPAGSLSESAWYERDWNRARALEAAELRDGLAARAATEPLDSFLASLPTSSDFCGSCPLLGSHCEGDFGARPAPALTLVRPA